MDKIVGIDFTHFLILKPGKVRGFRVTTCERCDCEVEAPNPVTLILTPAAKSLEETRERMLALGMTEVDHQFEELLLAEHLDGICVCSTCYNTTLAKQQLASRKRYSIHLTNLSGSEEQLTPQIERLKTWLSGTYMDLEVIAAPMGGGVHVTVSGFAVNEREVIDMVLGVMTETIASGKAEVLGRVS